MQGLGGAIARLLVMGGVMSAVLVGAVFAGLAATTAIALGVVGAGVVGLLGVARRPAVQKLSSPEQIAEMMAPPAPSPNPRQSIARDEHVMAPPVETPVDP